MHAKLKQKWSDLSPNARRAITIAATAEGILKTAALADLARRPADEVRGRKSVWATAITVINSLGIVPVAYFVRGVKRQPK